MTGTNFDWFLHTMLFYHTQQVIERQKRRNTAGISEEEDRDEDEDEDGDEDEE